MPRLSQKQYEWRVLGAMSLYTACMLLEWPLVRTTASVPLKCLLALLPVAPMVYVIWLGIATAVVGALSLAGGFLCIAQVLTLDGSILIWVFPCLMFGYGVSRWLVTRRYGISMFCESDASVAKSMRLIISGCVMLAVAWLCRSSANALGLGVLCGAGASLLGMGVVVGLMQRRQRRHVGE